MTGVPAHATGGPAHGRRTGVPVPGTSGGPGGAVGRATGAAGIAAMAAMGGGTPKSRGNGGRVDASRVGDDPAGTGHLDGTPEAAARPVRLWNIANALTMLRLVLVPGFVLLLVHGDGHDPVWRSFAWAAFAVAMITDLFDGELARRHNLVTDFGKIADPIADKAIMGAALVGLSALADLPWWVTALILLREVGITVMRFWVIKHAVIPASRGGKLKTLTQGVAVGMYVLILTGPLASLRAWFMAAAVVLTVVTGLDYVRQAVTLRRDARRRAATVEGAVDGLAAGEPAVRGAEVPGGRGADGAGVEGGAGFDVRGAGAVETDGAGAVGAGADGAAGGGDRADVLPAGATASGAARAAEGDSGAPDGLPGTRSAGGPEA